MIGMEPRPRPWEDRLRRPDDPKAMSLDADDWGTCALAELKGIRIRTPASEHDRIDGYIAQRHEPLWYLGHRFAELVRKGDFAAAELVRMRMARHRDAAWMSGHVLEGPAQSSPWERLPGRRAAA